MASVYDFLRLLGAKGWRRRFRIGTSRILEHPSRPGVLITVKGHLSRPLSRKETRQLLNKAGLKESDL